MNRFTIEDEFWTTIKCKRCIRPLQSKLISFNDLILKYPSYLEIDASSVIGDTKRTYNGRRQKPYSTRTNKTRDVTTTRLRTRKYNDDSDYEDTELTFDIGSSPVAVESSPRPVSSSERFRSLVKTLPEETASEYKEIFAIFKNFINSAYFAPPTKLQHLTSLKLGKCIVLTSKLNNTMFENDDPNSLIHINPLTNAKYVDEDTWYGFNNGSVQFNRWIVLGHGIELIGLYNPILFPLIPTLVHFLVEQQYHVPARILLSNFMENFSPNLKVFWIYIEKSIFREVCGLVDVDYEPELLKHLHNKISFDIIVEQDLKYLELVYELMLSSPRNESNSLIILTILKKFKKVYQHLVHNNSEEDFFILVVNLIQVWIEIYDRSQFNVNRLIFDKLDSLCQYLKHEEEQFKYLLIVIILLKGHYLGVIEEDSERQDYINRHLDQFSSIIVNIMPTYSRLEQFLRSILRSHRRLVLCVYQLYYNEFLSLNEYNKDLSLEDFESRREWLFEDISDDGSPDLNDAPEMTKFVDSEYISLISTSSGSEDEYMRISTPKYEKQRVLKRIENLSNSKSNSKSSSPLIFASSANKSADWYEESSINERLRDGDRSSGESDGETQQLNGSPVMKRRLNDNYITFRKKRR